MRPGIPIGWLLKLAHSVPVCGAGIREPGGTRGHPERCSLASGRWEGEDGRGDTPGLGVVVSGGSEVSGALQ